MCLKLNGFYYCEVDPNDLVTIDKQGKSRPYKRNFWEKIGQVIKYGETLESFTIMYFKKINDQYYCYYDCISGRLIKMQKLIEEIGSNYYEPVIKIGKYDFEFINNKKKYYLYPSADGAKIVVKLRNEYFDTFYFQRK